jgi:uncharacterized protein YecE (DUF72 family)
MILSPKSQLDLFVAERERQGRWGGFPPEEVVALGGRVPAGLRLGTSSWAFPGWGGICYPVRRSESQLARDGLAEYGRYPLFGTVGIDRGYYAPIPAVDLARYAGQLPAGFPCVSKVWEVITTRHGPPHPRWGARAGRPNPDFLNASLFADVVVAPYAEAFGEHAGPFLLQFPPSALGALPSAGRFAEELDRFLSRAPRGFTYAVEVRDRQLLQRCILEALAAHGASWVVNYWTRMPPPSRQLRVPGIFTAPFVVARLSLPPGRVYAERRAELAPFDRIVEPDHELRASMAALWRQAAAEGRQVFILVNNKAEGSAPLTVRAIAEEIVGT